MTEGTLDLSKVSIVLEECQYLPENKLSIRRVYLYSVTASSAISTRIQKKKSNNCSKYIRL